MCTKFFSCMKMPSNAIPGKGRLFKATELLRLSQAVCWWQVLFKCLYRLFWWSYKSTSASGWYSNPAFSVIPPCSVCYSTVSLVRNSPRTTTPGYVATRLKSLTFWFLLCFNILSFQIFVIWVLPLSLHLRFWGEVRRLERHMTIKTQGSQFIFLSFKYALDTLACWDCY